MSIDDVSIDDVRARLERLPALPATRADIRALLDDHARLAAEVAGWRKGAAAEAAEADRLRALLDVIDQACGHNRPERCAESLAAEIERLTRERDEKQWVADQARSDLSALHTAAHAYISEVSAEKQRRLWGPLCDAVQRSAGAAAAHDARVRAEALREAAAERDRLAAASEAACRDRDGRIAALVIDRDRLAAALAEVREAYARHGAAGVSAALTSTPTNLAAAHDARVRAEAYTDGVHAGRATMARDAAGVAAAEAARIRRTKRNHAARLACLRVAEAVRGLCLTEAERIGGGR